MSFDRTNSLILPVINSVYPSYSWLGLTKEELADFVLNSDTSFGNDIVIAKDKINKLINDRVEVLLKDDTYTYQTITSFLGFLFNNSKKRDVVGIFKKLDTFFKNHDYFPDRKILIRLLNDNSLFLKIVKSINNKYSNDSLDNDSLDVINNSSLMLTLETYQELNGKVVNDYYLALRKIGKVPDNIGIYLKEIAKFPLLSAAEEKELYHRIINDDKTARERFINCNLRLVVTVASNYVGRGLSLEDLIQEGNLGLMKAVDYFDGTKGFKFSTYAWWWIRQAITRAIADKGRNIRIPVHLYEKLQNYGKRKSLLVSKLNKEPTIEEIVEYTGLPLEAVNQYEKLLADTISLNVIVGDEEDTELAEFVQSKEPTPEEVVIHNSLRKKLRDIIENCGLKDREKEVIILRFGLEDDCERTLEEVGQMFGVTRERIRQIETKALKKLRNPKITSVLLEYTSNMRVAAINVGLIKEEEPKDQEEKQKNQKEEKKMRVKHNSIYEYFDGYSEQEVDKVFPKLTENARKYFEEYKQLISANGSFDPKIYQNFYAVARVQIMKCLNDPEYIPGYKKHKKTDGINPIPKKNIKRDPTLNIDMSYNANAKKEGQEILKTESKPTIIIHQEDITKNDYSSMLELLRSPSFTEMMSVLSPKEAIIISLRLGYVDGKYFTPKAISSFLGVEETEVNEITKKVLLMYKDNFNNFLDKLLEGSETISEMSRQYIKLPTTKKD